MACDLAERNNRDSTSSGAGASSTEGSASAGILPSPKELPLANNVSNLESVLPKIELIAFEGKEPKSWSRKCEKYFEVFKVPRD